MNEFLIILAFTLNNFMWMCLFWLFVPQQEKKKLKLLPPILPHKKSDTLSEEDLADLTDVDPKTIISNMLQDAKDKVKGAKK